MPVIDIPELNMLFTPDDFAGRGAIVAAVSGGGDSLALLFLLQRYLQSCGEADRLVAVTVDHGLRAESAAEAAGVAALCARHGIAHKTMRWQGEKPQSALAQHARAARYDLLCQAAEALGARVIVAGHTLDDQVETYMMRLQREQAGVQGEGSGRGLAGMPRLAVLRQKFRLLRPLLDVRRIALRRYLQTRNIGWVDDPSNDNPAYERVRVRRCLDDAIVDKARAAVLCAHARRAKRACEMTALVEQNRLRLRGERLWLSRGRAEEAPSAAFNGLVMACAAIIGGREQVPVCTAMVQRRLEAGGRTTLAGAVIEVTGKYVRLWREKRNLADVTLGSGDETVWDGRYRIKNNSGAPLRLRAPDHDELRAAVDDTSAARDIDRHWPSLETTCVLERKGRVVLPVLQGAPAGVTIERILRPFDWLVADSERPLLAALQPVFAFKA